MSGGVDSSVSLILLKQQGFEPIGVSLKYAVWQDKENQLRENVCCDSESFKIAKYVCQKLDIPYHIIDVSQEFQKTVIDYFTDELKKNLTPNPCVVCNPQLKFDQLFKAAKKLGANYVATGHYAQIRQNSKTKLCQLLKAKDLAKDQTYSLAFLPQKLLGKIILPLGKYTKSEVIAMAQAAGFSFYEKRKQSQDFCFVSGKSLNSFLTKSIGLKEGPIKNLDGKILGSHLGLHFYTIGQRKGIKLAGGPYFVVGFDLKDNTLLVSKSAADLNGLQTTLKPCNFISQPKPTKPITVKAKIRSQHSAAKAKLETNNGSGILTFSKPQKAITPGQYAVFYNKNICLGGGKIIKVKKYD